MSVDPLLRSLRLISALGFAWLLEVAAQEQQRALGWEALHDGGEACNVREEDRDLRFLSF